MSDLTATEIAVAHAIADSDAIVWRYRRATDTVSDHLTTALAALRAGDYAVVGEFLDRSLFALSVARREGQSC